MLARCANFLKFQGKLHFFKNARKVKKNSPFAKVYAREINFLALFAKVYAENFANFDTRE